ncbi:hypothetical protein FHX64_001091 [Microbacter margulisiae]|uniref:Uncharacterized protein n=1 Tax=Microbacter margulisiae TaxID=1350067 RepID=A0A7W5DRK3_9PORP|nr:hypothetical protein [Microbacter margulisiae]
MLFKKRHSKEVKEVEKFGKLEPSILAKDRHLASVIADTLRR